MSSAASYRARSVKGMRDLLPPETALWVQVEETARRIFGRYGYDEIRTPLVEETELFVRSVGAATDIVGKEMYSFPDKKGKSLSLRPETTASVARAFSEHLRAKPLPVRLYYIGPQFRYERPQHGRYRQFHHIGAELIGDEGPWSDAEVILMLFTFLRELGFVDLRALVNSVGDPTDRESYKQRLRAYLEPRAAELGEDSRRRLDTNPLRILDTKVPTEIELLESAPRLVDSLGEESRRHFRDLRCALDGCGVEYETDDRLVRGLDYYTRTVFEIVSPSLGAHNAIVGGGRYDGLIEEVGGPSTPAIGFAIGQDRLMEVLPEATRRAAARTARLYVVPVGDVSRVEMLRLGEEIRHAGLTALLELSTVATRTALRRADRMGIRWAVLLGQDEISRGTVAVKDFRSGEQTEVDRTALGAELPRLIEGDER